MGNKGPLKVLNGTKLILDVHGNNLDSFRISLESFRSFKGPLLPESVTGQELFLVVSYSKPVLIDYCPNKYNVSGGLKMLLMSTLHHVVKEIKINQESRSEF